MDSPSTAVMVSPGSKAGFAREAAPGSLGSRLSGIVTENGLVTPTVGMPRSVSGWSVSVRSLPSAGRCTVKSIPWAGSPSVTPFCRSVKTGWVFDPMATISSPVRNPARQAAPPGRTLETSQVSSCTPRPNAHAASKTAKITFMMTPAEIIAIRSGTDWAG